MHCLLLRDYIKETAFLLSLFFISTLVEEMNVPLYISPFIGIDLLAFSFQIFVFYLSTWFTRWLIIVLFLAFHVPTPVSHQCNIPSTIVPSLPHTLKPAPLAGMK